MELWKGKGDILYKEGVTIFKLQRSYFLYKLWREVFLSGFWKNTFIGIMPLLFKIVCTYHEFWYSHFDLQGGGILFLQLWLLQQHHQDLVFIFHISSHFPYFPISYLSKFKPFALFFLLFLVVHIWPIFLRH